MNSEVPYKMSDTETGTGTGGRLAYNATMDEDKIREEKNDEPQAPEPPADPAAKSEAEPQPELFTRMPLSDKDKWRPGGGLGRLPVYGCVFGVILLIAALILGISLLRRTVWMTMERGSQQVVQSLPMNLDPAVRLRTTRNLSRFRTVLESKSDPYPMMGEFLKRVRAFFDDGDLTAEEVEELNLFLEKIIEESGIPLMQRGPTTPLILDPRCSTPNRPRGLKPPPTSLRGMAP
jgi:hypothetical protein